MDFEESDAVLFFPTALEAGMDCGRGRAVGSEVRGQGSGVAQEMVRSTAAASVTPSSNVLHALKMIARKDRFYR